MLYLGADHRGFHYKEKIKEFLKKEGIPFKDLGNMVYDPEDDYPDFARKVAKKVAENPEKNRGILLCSSGIGMAIMANRYRKVRAGTCISSWLVEHGRQNDDINILVIAAEITDFQTVKNMIKKFLSTPFRNEEKYLRRIKKLDKL